MTRDERGAVAPTYTVVITIVTLILAIILINRVAWTAESINDKAETIRASAVGIQADSSEALGDVYARLHAAERPIVEEGRTTCCYAKSEKSWIADPDGVVWEAFLTSGEATVYGDSPPLSALSADAAAASCCVPSVG